MVLKTLVLLLVAFGPFCSYCKPMGGKFAKNITLDMANPKPINGSCYMIGLYDGSTVSITGRISASNAKTTRVKLVAKLFKMQCANFLKMERMQEFCTNGSDTDKYFVSDFKAIAVIHRTFNTSNPSFKFSANMTTYFVNNKPYGVTVPNDATSDTTTIAATTSVATTDEITTQTKDQDPDNPSVQQSKRAAKNDESKDDNDKTPKGGGGSPGDNKNNPAPSKGKAHPVVFEIGTANLSEAGAYLLQIYIAPEDDDTSKTAAANASLDVVMRNPHGLLSAIDYPALVFYGIMTSVYAIFAVAWIVMMLCSFNDLVRLQFWVLAVIILGFLEKTFFVAEYSAINLGSETTGSFMVAEFVSAVKRGLSRMLLIIVAMGFGTVKPRLGDSLFKVVAAGILYFALALIDGLMRAKSDTFHIKETPSMVTFGLLLILDAIIFYWIFLSIVDTRRTLRLRKNYVKLSMYNHFAYTLIFAILATLGFTVWSFMVLDLPTNNCLKDWREVWLRDCFWHVLFAFILLVVMVIWRPSSNRSRFAYSLVADNDEEEVVFEQGNNKNFDTVKMRQLHKSSEPPPVANQAEDDLRWVEENLPTTAMDKAIPLLLDSDEEVMTTKFEISKMN